jgi:hypothetical protein
MEKSEELRQMDTTATATRWREHFFNWLALGVLVALGFV